MSYPGYNISWETPKVQKICTNRTHTTRSQEKWRNTYFIVCFLDRSQWTSTRRKYPNAKLWSERLSLRTSVIVPYPCDVIRYNLQPSCLSGFKKLRILLCLYQSLKMKVNFKSHLRLMLTHLRGVLFIPRFYILAFLYFSGIWNAIFFISVIAKIENFSSVFILLKATIFDSLPVLVR